MSLVRPRPSGKSEVELNSLRLETGVFNLKLGITGLAQINGRNKLAENNTLKNEFDLKYSKKISFFKDVKIMLQTLVYVLKRKDIK